MRNIHEYHKLITSLIYYFIWYFTNTSSTLFFFQKVSESLLKKVLEQIKPLSIPGKENKD